MNRVQTEYSSERVVRTEHDWGTTRLALEEVDVACSVGSSECGKAEEKLLGTSSARTHWYLSVVSIVLSLILVACGTGPSPKVEKTNAPASKLLPEWVGNPTILDGIASTGCVLWGGDFSLDRAEAVAEARAELAKMIEIKVTAMDKTYGSKNRAGSDVAWGGVFETVSKQVTEHYLSASQVVNVDMVEVKKKQHLCAMVVLEGMESRKLFYEIVGSSSVAKQVSAQDQELLWKVFNAYKGHEELSDETR